jgi:glycosyltransferase involved in cell wall biosynthesis
MINEMKTSLVITVFNEEKTIERLLDSLANQTKQPDEIIFVDGGSADNTVVEIEKWRRKNGELKIKVLVKKGSTIAQGRNEGIKEAKGEIIAMTDAGCWIHPDWFEKIMAPFEDKEIDIAAGFYRMTGETVFQKCLACYLGVLPEKLNPLNFMPSARSIAFRKEIWERIGGFNEKLERAGEDTLFNYQAKKMGSKFVTVKEALVDWEMPKTWKEAIKKFYFYAKGDGQISIKTHNLKIISIYLRYLLGLGLIALGGLGMLEGLIIVYLFWAVWKNYRYVKSWQAVLILPEMQIISDFVVMAGFPRGCLSPISKK